MSHFGWIRVVLLATWLLVRIGVAVYYSGYDAGNRAAWSACRESRGEVEIAAFKRAIEAASAGRFVVTDESIVCVDDHVKQQVRCSCKSDAQKLAREGSW